MKLCVDCKHYVQPEKVSEIVTVREHSKCHAPQNMDISPVTGESVVKEFKYCYTLRGNKYCGPDAAWYESREGA